MRTLSRGALAVVLSITGLAAPMAASAALSRAQLEDLEHHLWQVRTDYHMYAVMDGNDTYRVALNEAAQQAAEALDELRAASESDAERALVADLADQWQRMAADQALPAPGDAEGEAAIRGGWTTCRRKWPPASTTSKAPPTATTTTSTG
jgi:ABC-type sugar transport system substrate-binding protein